MIGMNSAGINKNLDFKKLECFFNLAMYFHNSSIDGC